MSSYSEVKNAYEGLRVTDVCDGMDAIGMHDLGQLSDDIRPLWRDSDQFAHRIYGVAHTVRFVPTDKAVPKLSPEEFFEWMEEWYATMAQGPISSEISVGDVIVIDGSQIGTVGFIGSNNSLSWIAAGAVGIVTNGAARDTDEIIKQRIPTYCRATRKTIRPGRLELESTQTRINVAGASVSPGDVVVADGDGVVVVPQTVAEDVAKYAWRHASNDKNGRKKLYEQVGLPSDFTVEQ